MSSELAKRSNVTAFHNPHWQSGFRLDVYCSHYGQNGSEVATSIVTEITTENGSTKTHMGTSGKAGETEYVTLMLLLLLQGAAPGFAPRAESSLCFGQPSSSDETTSASDWASFMQPHCYLSIAHEHIRHPSVREQMPALLWSCVGFQCRMIQVPSNLAWDTQDLGLGLLSITTVQILSSSK